MKRKSKQLSEVLKQISYLEALPSLTSQQADQAAKIYQCIGGLCKLDEKYVNLLIEDLKKRKSVSSISRKPSRSSTAKTANKQTSFGYSIFNQSRTKQKSKQSAANLKPDGEKPGTNKKEHKELDKENIQNCSDFFQQQEHDECPEKQKKDLALGFNADYLELQFNFSSWH